MNTQQIVNELNSTIGGFTAKVNTKIDNVDAITAQIQSTTDKTYNEIKNFKQSMIENEQMQSAQENILRINQIIRERFGDYDDIRRTVMGVVKDFDINLVRNKTIQELSEELWITSSRYWLSYTLIALSAWVCDNKTIASNALGESYRVDKIKTSLFFCLTNLRFNRIDVAREWLVEYFTTIVPEDIQDETAVLLQSYINGVFGVDKELEYVVKEVVDNWIAEINIDDSVSEELVGMYESYIKNLAQGSMYKNEFISKYCVNAKDLPYSYLEATKYDALINAIEKVDVENVVQNAANFKERIDIILKDLITNYDSEELELKQQQEYFNLVIENKGKEEIANAQFNELLEQRNKTQNIGRKCVEWALYGKEVNIHVQKFGYQNTKSWYLKAVNNWSLDFEEKFPEEYKIAIEDWSCVSNGDDAEEQEISLRNHLEQNKFKIKYVNKGNIIFLILTLLSLILGIAIKGESNVVNIVFFGVAAVFAVILAVRIFTANSKFNKKVKLLLSLLSGTMTEIAQYRKTYYENRDKKAKLFSLVEHL